MINIKDMLENELFIIYNKNNKSLIEKEDFKDKNKDDCLFLHKKDLLILIGLIKDENKKVYNLIDKELIGLDKFLETYNPNYSYRFECNNEFNFHYLDYSFETYKALFNLGYKPNLNYYELDKLKTNDPYIFIINNLMNITDNLNNEYNRSSFVKLEYINNEFVNSRDYNFKELV